MIWATPASGLGSRQGSVFAKRRTRPVNSNQFAGAALPLPSAAFSLIAACPIAAVCRQSRF
jgi:hypothetical protein